MVSSKDSRFYCEFDDFFVLENKIKLQNILY